MLLLLLPLLLLLLPLLLLLLPLLLPLLPPPLLPPLPHTAACRPLVLVPCRPPSRAHPHPPIYRTLCTNSW